MSTIKKFGTYLLSNNKTRDQLFDLNLINNVDIKTKLEVPDSFNGRNVWNKYFINVPDQSKCISCWVFASLFVLSTRLSIYTKGEYKLNFSPSKMIFGKNNDNDKLNSWDDIKKEMSNKLPFDFSRPVNLKTNVIEPSVGSLIEAWQYLYRFGVCESFCANDSLSENVYSSIQLFGESYDKCPSRNENEMISHRIAGYYYVPGTLSKNIKFEDGNEYNIRRDIYHWGPSCSVMKIFSDFIFWNGEGIYEWDGKSGQVREYGHAVIIVGWGEENGKKYWNVCNTWGDKWGDKGYFKILRGMNHCEIEENVFNGYPILPGIRLYLEYPILYNFDDFIIRNLWGIKDNGYKLTSYEKIMLKKKPNVILEKNEYLYKKESWPDFSKLISGDVSTIIFNLVKENYRLYYSDASSDKKDPHLFLNMFIITVLLGIVMKIFLKIKNKRLK